MDREWKRIQHVSKVSHSQLQIIIVLIYLRGLYLLPVDEKEKERLDMIHTMIRSARPKESRLHLAPFSEISRDPATGFEEPARVLDLGYGTAIWLLDMAAKYAGADFQGVDLANIAPESLFQNINARSHVDFEGPWSLGANSFDLIHMSMGLGSVSNWPLLYEKVYAHLKPGGYFEHVELDWTPHCSDNTLPPGRLQEWWHTWIKPLYAGIGRRIEFDHNTENLLRGARFHIVAHHVYKVPLNGWSNQKQERIAGTWWENAMSFGQERGHGFEALSLAILTNVGRWPAEAARKLCEEASMEASNPNIHAYNDLHVWVAQKPTA